MSRRRRRRRNAPTDVISVRVTPTLRAELEQAAKERGTSMAAEITERLRSESFLAPPAAPELPIAPYRRRQILDEESMRLAQLQWSVVWTKPGAEYVAEQHLDEQQFDTFLPERIDTVRTKRGVRERTKVPRFPGYLFVGLMAGQAWGPINNTRGVHKLIASSTGVPCVLTSNVVEKIRAMSLNDRAVQEVVRPAWEEGELLRVISGILEGHNVMFSHWDKQTAVVTLTMMARQVEKPMDPITLAKL